jgi:hypothetical protein
MPTAPTTNGQKTDPVARAIRETLQSPASVFQDSEFLNVVDAITSLMQAVHHVARTIDAADVGCSTGLSGAIAQAGKDVREGLYDLADAIRNKD